MKNKKQLIAVLLAATITVTGINFYNINDAQMVYATEFTVTEKNSILYSNDNTKVYVKPDSNSSNNNSKGFTGKSYWNNFKWLV